MFGEKSDRLVEAWSTFRLPFQPKTHCAANLRTELAAAVRSLRSQNGEILSGTYISPPSRPEADAENVLFYNVQTANLALAARGGLRFERCFEQPPVPLTNTIYNHYCRYELTTKRETFAFWRLHHLAQFEVELTAEMIPDASAIWWVVRRRRPAASFVHSGRPFALILRLIVPSMLNRYPASDMKSLFDGVISAFHYHGRHGPDDVAQRLASRLSVSPSEIKTALTDSSGAVLGPTNLVYPHRKGVKWNPSDELCVAGELIQSIGIESHSDPIRLTGILATADN